MNFESEKWAKIEETSNFYMVSNYGNIINKNGNIKPRKTNYGYHDVRLTHNGRRKRYFIHRLVGKYFIPNPDNKPQINHKDGNKLNNHFENLEWCTQSENNNHALLTGLRKYHIFEPNYKSCIQLDKDDNIIAIWRSLSDAGRILKIDPSGISASCKNKRKTLGGYKWKYF